MAMILNAFVSRYIGKLSEFMEGEMSMMLGVKDELEKLQTTMERISGFLESAERKRHADKIINMWVRKLKDVMYDADDIIDLCMIKGSKLLKNDPSESAVCRPLSLFSSCSCIKFRHKIGHQIRKLNDRLKEIEEDISKLPMLENKNQSAQESGVNLRQTFPSTVKSDIVGTQIEETTRSLVESLIKEDDKKYRVLGIVGMGGIGKTTLASNIYDDERIKDNFPIRVWACVSKEFSKTKLLKDIIRGAGGEYKNDENEAELVPRLSSILSKRFFIVLDDIWSTNLWEDLLRIPFEKAAANGKIVITTRDTNVAKNMRAEIHRVDKMDNDSGWKLLRKKVFGDDEEEEGEISSLREIGVKIVKKCDGLPLAIKAIAGVLMSKGTSTTGWDMVLNSDAWSMSRLNEELPGALFLSYEDLHSDLKQCFLYCSLFPEDSRIYREDLIRYWVAEGFVKSIPGDALMEDYAEDYYNELIWRNLLHGHDDDTCGIHDVLRSLALFLVQDESTFLGDDQSLNKNPLTRLRRLSMVNMEGTVEVPDAVKQQKCLRTLMLRGSPRTKMIENELLERLRFLRIITINDMSLESLPNSIGDLLHLRYLELNWTKIKELPESIGRLVNLQTLSLSGCEFLHSLPKAVTKLCNLRCLRLEGTPLTHVPKGIGKLKHLNHLQGFVVGHDDRRGIEDDDGCDLAELQSLSHLRFLKIKRLERAEPGGAPVLANSHFLKTLILNCRRLEDEVDAIAIQRIDKIYNELSPQSTHLQRLQIRHFFCTGFPSWMMSTSLDVSFPDLTKIELYDCKSCPQLPPLGLLPQLKYLRIDEADAIKTIGPEFLGPRSTSFPKLEELMFRDMSNWEEWSFGMVEEGVGEEGRGAPKLLPHLTKLTLYSCPKLRALPPLGMLPKLKFLSIDVADAIKTIGPEFLGPRSTSFPKLEDLMFRDMSHWEEWSFGMVDGVGEEGRGAPKLLPHLTKLSLYWCPKLRALPPLGLLPQLKYLRIQEADAIKTIGPEFLGPRSTSFPKLEELMFRNMFNWEEWSFGMVEEGVGEEGRGAPKLLPHLTKLSLYSCPKLRALPQGLQHATNLQQLIIYNAGDLIEINNLPSLKSLEIDGCPRLEHVENLDELEFLKFSTSTKTSTSDADGETERLPRWLLELLQNAPTALPSLKEFRLKCRLPFLKTFLKDGPNWSIIQRMRIPQIRIEGPWNPFRDSSYIQYTKDPPTFEAHIDES